MTWYTYKWYFVNY